MISKLKSVWKKIVSLWHKATGKVKAFKAKIYSLFFKKYSGKDSLKLGTFLGGLCVVFLVLSIGSSVLFSPEDNSSSYNTAFNASSDEDMIEGAGEEYEADSEASNIKGLGSNKGKRLSGSDPEPGQKRGRVKIKYAGKQVLVRNVSQGDRALPIGTNFIGKLLSQVDTRHSDKFVRVLLPFGGKFKDRMGLPRNTVLLGQVGYPGRGKRLFISFHTGVLPDGTEVKVEASAVDAKDFSPGLLGSYHSAFGSRAGATLGFSFVAGASDVLQEREALGREGLNVVKKANLKNAMLNGVSEFAKTEGAFQLEEARSESAYVTLNQGKELIVTLTKTFIKGETR